MKHLVIVESPSKARTIERYLGKGFQVLSSYGHIRDLPPKELGVDVERGFEAQLVVTNPKQARLLRQAVKGADLVYLATDNDREGEAIAFDLHEILCKKNESTPYRRVVFNEITKPVIQGAIQRPTEINRQRVEAQRARRVLDRLVGYLISPLLSKALSGNKFEGLSAGRVQSVALRQICERELAIQAFVPEEYWNLLARFATSPDGSASFGAQLQRVQGQKPRIADKSEADRLIAELQELPFSVKSVEQKPQRRTPPPPFITSTLQQAASSQLRFTPKRTMRLAQQLYEGVELGQGPEGLITYMRTDSLRLSEQALQQARARIESEFGSQYLSPQPRIFKNKKKSQDAHEAIRPTHPEYTPQAVKERLEPDQFRLYELIWRRFMATQMADARYERTRLRIEAGEGAYEFRASASRCTFEGFMAVLPLPPLQDEDANLPALQEGQALHLREVKGEQKFTEPPKRFSEASLIKEMEAKGIGRPSTYASIVSTVQDRGYVFKEKGSLRPTLLGFVTADFLEEYFPITVQTEFTARMEEELDLIAEGQRTRRETLDEFYRPLAQRLAAVQAKIKEGQLDFRVLSDYPCERCGAPMEVRFWKGSRFLGCSSYPRCKSTVNFPEDVSFEYASRQVKVQEQLKAQRAQDEPQQQRPCPNCGAPMAIKQGPYGRFWGCTRYPECKTTEPVVAAAPCPRCGSPLIERFSKKRKRRFWGCSQYPACAFTVNAEPLKACPACEEGVLVAQDGETLVCSNKACGHTEPCRDEAPAA